jgi:nickel transport protein
MKRILPIPAYILLWMLPALMVSLPAYAHKVMVFGYLEGGRVYLEGYFADGKKAENSVVEVFEKGGRKLLEGKTDEQGVFTFPAPDVPEINVVLTASMGHRAGCVVELEKRSPSGKAAPATPDKPEEAVATGSAKKSVQKQPAEIPEPGPKSDTVIPGMTAVGEDRIRAIISEELDKKLAPLHREVTLLGQEKTSLPDIIGGIGYIAGIMGIIMYFKVRKGSGA